jgi:hemerythrin superfamily protein
VLAALHDSQAALTVELDEHIAFEEAHVFAPIDETLGDGLTNPFREDHREIGALRDEVYAHASRGIAAHDACLRLCEALLDHQQREDLMLFPTAREALPSMHPAHPEGS